MSIFSFLGDFDNYDERAVARDEISDGLMIDTCSVSDGSQPYETAVMHPEYNDGKWVIVEAYDTKKAAKEGHKRWKATMTAEKLPEALIDCQNAHIAKLCAENRFPRQKATA
jgi:hypothetical protein